MSEFIILLNFVAWFIFSVASPEFLNLDKFQLPLLPHNAASYHVDGLIQVFEVFGLDPVFILHYQYIY